MGGKHVDRSKRSDRASSRALRYAEDDEMYARCVGKLGCGRFTLQIRDGSEIVGKIVGALYKRAWVNKTDLVLVSTRILVGPSGANVYDIVHKFSPDEERVLARYGELRNWKIRNDFEHTEERDDEDIDDVVFEDDI
jgi:initiation factor 1A